MVEKKAVFTGALVASTPAPPARLELREAGERAPAVAPGVAPTRPVSNPIYEGAISEPTAESVFERKAAAQALIDVLRVQLESAKDKSRRGRLHYEWARLLEEPLGDLAGALEHYQKAHEATPEHEPSIVGARRVRLRRGEYEAALPWFDAQLRLARTPLARAELAYEKAMWLEGPLGRPGEARKALEAARELSPHDAALQRALSRARRRDQAWVELERSLEAQAQDADEDAGLSAARLAERARLVEVKRRDLDGAAALLQSAFGKASGATVALSDLERLHGAQRPHELAALLEEKVRLSQDPQVRAAVLVRLARVHVDRLGELDAGARALERAHAEQPADAVTLRELSLVYERAGDTAGLRSALERRVQLSGSRDEKLELLGRLGLSSERELGDAAAAIADYERARALDPAHPGITDALLRLYERAGDAERRIVVLLGIAEGAQLPARRAEALFQVATIEERERGQRERAVAALEQALGIAPGHTAAFAALTRLLAEFGRHVDLVEQYERAVERAEDDATAFVWLFKIGRVHEDALGAPGRALDAYQRILARSPHHLDALLAAERAAARAGDSAARVGLLETQAHLLPAPRKLQLLTRAAELAAVELGSESRALSLLDQVLALDARFAPALDALRRVHERAGRVTDLIAVYEKELALASDGPSRARLCFAIGELYERQLAQDEPAIAHYKKALEHDANHEPSSHALVRRLLAAERYDELARQAAREVERHAEPAQKAEWALRLGQLYENRLKKLPEALKAYELAATHAPGSRQAIDGRQRILAASANHKALVAALDEDAATTSEPLVRLQARLRAAEVLRDELGQLDEAAARYVAVLEEQPGHVGALLALEHLWGELGDPAALVRVLNQQVESLAHLPERVAALRELVRLGAGSTEPQPALAAILQHLPDDRRALERLELEHLRSGDSVGLARVDAVLSRDEASPALAAAHATRWAEQLEGHEPWKALGHYRRALQLDPENIAAARGISRVATTSTDPSLLLEAAEAEARVTADVASAARLFAAAAEALRARGDTEGAAAALERALAVDPEQFAAARALHELLTASGGFDRLVDSLSSAAQRATSQQARTGHWIAVARTHANHRGDLPAALTALLRVEKSEPNHPATLLELGELYMRDKQFQQAATRFERAAKLSLSPAQLLQTRLRLAALYQEHLGRAADARRLLGEVLEGEPLHREALRRLIALQMAERDSSAVETARAWVQASEGAEKAEGSTTLGRLYRDGGRFDEARAAFEAAVELVGVGEPGAGADLRQLLAERGDREGWEGYARALTRFIESGRAPEATAEAYVELGRVYLDELSDANRGFPALERGLAALPEARALRVEYSSRLMHARRHAQALDELRKLLALEPARVDTWRDLVTTFDALGRNAEAHLAHGPLVLAGGGNELVRSTWQARVARPALVPADALDASTLQLFSPDVSAEAETFLSQLSELGTKLFGPGLERFQLSSRDRVSSRSTHPLRPLFDRVLRAFGVAEMDLYPASEYEGAATLVLTDPLGLVVPRSFAGLSEVEQVFVFSRFVASVARGPYLVDVLNDPELNDLVLAGGRWVEPRFAPNRSSGGDLEAIGRRIGKALPWLAKGRFEEAARRFVQSRPVDGAALGLALRRAALRTALVVADDVSPLLLLQRTRGAVVGLTPEESKAAQLDLLQWWVSEPSIEARKRAGLL
ncbi:MAG TPA: hypothetical protein VLC09_14555 [Polyangiaceae bacterium]|nr:hypothetical protein [Polyangiaceae bacterium]